MSTKSTPRGIRNNDPSKWVPISGCPGYEVHPDGFVRSLKRKNPKILRQHRHKDGYLSVIVFGGHGERHRLMVHRVVAEHFIPKINKKDIVCHNNGKLSDNSAKNLRWATQKENILDKHIHGTMLHGEDCNSAKLNRYKVLEIRNSQMSFTGLGKIYGVSRTTICHVVKRRTWKHV